MIFLDTSALVKAYLHEAGTSMVHALLDQFKGLLYVSNHVALETLATLAYKHRDGRLTKRQYRRAREEFFADFRNELRLVPVTDEILRTAMRLADDHRKLGVGAVDLIHVATVLHLRSQTTPPSITVRARTGACGCWRARRDSRCSIPRTTTWHGSERRRTSAGW